MANKQIFITSINASDTTEKDNLGDIREENGKTYKYVKFITATVVAADVVKYASLAGYTASEVAPIATLALLNAGIAVVAQAVNDFGWIQIKGVSPTLAVDITGTPVIGGKVSSSATTKAFAQGVTLLAQYGQVLDLGSPDTVLLDCPL